VNEELATSESAAGRAEAVITAKAELDFRRAASSFPGAELRRFGSVIATRLPALPGHVPYNKARGCTANSGRSLAAISTFFTEVGVAPTLEVWAGDASPDLDAILREAGLAPVTRAVTLHVRPAGVSAATTPEVRVAEVGDGDEAYLETLLDGYGVDPDATVFRRMLTLEHRTPGLRRYLATIDSEPASAAALFISAGGSLLAGAATLPRFRGRGCQTALIVRRLRDAAADSDLVVATTALASTSRDNLVRHGFQVTHTRTSWRWPPATTRGDPA